MAYIVPVSNLFPDGEVGSCYSMKISCSCWLFPMDSGLLILITLMQTVVLSNSFLLGSPLRDMISLLLVAISVKSFFFFALDSLFWAYLFSTTFCLFTEEESQYQTLPAHSTFFLLNFHTYS